MATCTIEGRTLYYELNGNGPPLVLIRGLGSNADHWYAQLPVLTPHFKVLTFDNRGVGRSDDSEGDYTAKVMMEDTIALMNHVGFDKADVCGLSMGGMIAQELAITHPERVNALVLCVTHSGGEKQVTASPETADLFQRMVEEGTDEAKMAAAAALFADVTLKTKQHLIAAYGEISLKHPVPAEILRKQWGAVAKFDAWRRLPQISAPTLVLTAEDDRLIPPENAKILADRIPDSQLVILPDAGHQVLIEQAEAANKAILDFLMKHYRKP